MAGRRRLLVACLLSLALVLGAPFVGQLRAMIQRAVPGYFRIIVGSVVLGAIAAAVLAGLARIRQHRRRRYSLMTIALAIGVTYAAVAATGNPDVDAVERVHFVEYGLVTAAFYRVWRQRGDVATIAGPLLAGATVATADEWLQWFIPLRVGELHDVMLDLVAIGCGLLFALGVAPPPRSGWRLSADARRTATAFAASVVLIVALFVNVVHLGHDVRDGHTIFYSRFTATALDEAASDRAARWRSDPPLRLHRLSREDQYLSEGLWHVQRRNETGDPIRVWRENLILERFFAPVLDTPSYAAPSISRWPPEQRANAAQEAAAGEEQVYVSDAAPFPIYTWQPWQFWIVVMAIEGLVIWICRRLALPSSPATESAI